MRGNLRQILAIPEHLRTEAQHKAVIQISGTLNNARQQELEKGKKMAERISRLEKDSLPFENRAYVLMVMRALAYLANTEGFIPGASLKGMTDENPFMSSAAFSQLESLGYLNRLPDGALKIDVRGRRLLKPSASE